MECLGLGPACYHQRLSHRHRPDGARHHRALYRQHPHRSRRSPALRRAQAKEFLIAMKILWLTWKDKNHPRAGGAEVVNEELAKRLVADGHEVTFVVAQFPGARAEEERDGFRTIRVGGRYSVYWYAYRLYKKKFQGWPDLVIDEMNTIPFFARFYVREKTI